MINRIKKTFQGENSKPEKSPDVLFEEGKAYETGAGGEKDLTKAIQLYKQSADMGNIKAKHNLARLYIMQEGGLTNKEKGIEMMEELANEGISLAKVNLGQFLLEGRFVPQNIDKGLQLIKDASSQGEGAGSYSLGAYYINEQKDILKGVEYLELAATQDNEQAKIMACILLSQIYEQGAEESGVAKNLEKSFKYLQQAAELNDPFSQFKWGMVLIHIKHCFNTGVDWIRKAMQNGVEGAKKELESLDLAMVMPTEKRLEHFLLGLMAPDVEQSQSTYDKMWKCFELGDPFASYALGTLFHMGICVEKDQRKAIGFLKMSAEQGFTESYGMLGMALNSLEQYEEGNKYLLKGAELGDMHAIHNLGNSYCYARGVKQDLEKALQLWIQSAQMGNPDSLRSLGNCYLHGVVFEKNINKAIELFSQSANLGSRDAIKNLVDVYRELGNISQAQYWQSKLDNK